MALTSRRECQPTVYTSPLSRVCTHQPLELAADPLIFLEAAAASVGWLLGIGI